MLVAVPDIVQGAGGTACTVGFGTLQVLTRALCQRRGHAASRDQLVGISGV